MFGRETAGLPKSFLRQHREHWLRIPMFNEESRSLNLAIAWPLFCSKLSASKVLRGGLARWAPQPGFRFANELEHLLGLIRGQESLPKRLVAQNPAEPRQEMKMLGEVHRRHEEEQPDRVPVDRAVGDALRDAGRTR